MTAQIPRNTTVPESHVLWEHTDNRNDEAKFKAEGD